MPPQPQERLDLPLARPSALPPVPRSKNRNNFVKIVFPLAKNTSGEARQGRGQRPFIRADLSSARCGKKIVKFQEFRRKNLGFGIQCCHDVIARGGLDYLTAALVL